MGLQRKWLYQLHYIEWIILSKSHILLATHLSFIMQMHLLHFYVQTAQIILPTFSDCAKLLNIMEYVGNQLSSTPYIGVHHHYHIGTITLGLS